LPNAEPSPNAILYTINHLACQTSDERVSGP